MIENQLRDHRSRLIDLLSFARRSVPHYREYIPADVQGLVSDIWRWLRLPVVTKRQIQADWTAFLADPHAADDPAVKVLATSGSTGAPLKVARPMQELRAQTRRLWAARARWLPGIMQRRLLNLYFYDESPRQEMFRPPSDWPVDLSFRGLADLSRAIDDYRPEWMLGPPSALYRLAEHYRRRRQAIPALRFIEATGEQLYPHQRAFIEGVFGCPVVNHYGCREFWVLSYECPERTMHAWTDDLLIEVLRDGEPAPAGEPGEIVVTSLTNRCMPLIRYRLGDRMRMSPSDCSCGDTRPILEPVDGRVRSLLAGPEGTIPAFLLSDVFSRFVFAHERALLEYQVVQRDRDRLEIRLVPGDAFEKDVAVEELTRGIRRFLPGVHSRFVLCSEITPDPSGKTLTFVTPWSEAG